MSPSMIWNTSVSGFRARPAGHFFGHWIEVGDVARNVGAKYGVAYGVEGDLGAVPFHEKRVLDFPALDRV